MRFRFDDEKLGSFGSALSGVYAFLMLISFAINVFVFKSVGNFNQIINSAISIVFYIFVCSYFIKGKSNHHFLYIAILSLIISDYVLPLIFYFIFGFSIMLATLSFDLFLIPISFICGLLYFIFMYLERKNPRRKYTIIMEVCSIILFIISLISFGFAVYTDFVLISAAISSSSSAILLDMIFYIFSIVVLLLAALVSVGFPLVYFMYSINLKRGEY